MSPNLDSTPEQTTPKTDARLPYATPALEHLGAWSALTLQQSVPITLLSDPERTPKFG